MLAFGVVLATVAGSVIGVTLLLANLALVTVPPHAVPLRVGVATVPLAAAALSAAALVLLVGGRARAVRAEESRPGDPARGRPMTHPTALLGTSCADSGPAAC